MMGASGCLGVRVKRGEAARSSCCMLSRDGPSVRVHVRSQSEPPACQCPTHVKVHAAERSDRLGDLRGYMTPTRRP